MIDFSKFSFAPVIVFPQTYEVYDFTKEYNPHRKLNYEYGVGKYDEQRVDGMYAGELYGAGSEDKRNIHMGIDLAAPVGTPIHAPYDGRIFMFAYNSEPYDYGYTVITEHILDQVPLYILFGHLSKKSIEGKTIGQQVNTGETFAWVGDKHENGGWNPHLHIQLSYEKPKTCDLPGVVSRSQYIKAKKKFPDPRLILGPLY